MRAIDIGLALVVMLIWGFNFTVVKVGVGAMPPIFFVALRFALVAALLVGFVAVPRAHLRRIAWLALVLGGIHFTTMFTAISLVDSGTAAVVAQLQVPFAAILAAFVFKDRIGWRSALGMALAFAGVMVIAGEPKLGGGWAAMSLLVVASLAFAVANIQMKSLGAVDGHALNAWTAVFAAPLLFAISFTLETGQIEALRSLGWLGAGALAYQVLAMVVVSYWIWYRLLSRYAVSQVMPFMLLLPGLAVLFGVLLLGESAEWKKLLGGLMTVAGVAIIIIRRARVTEPRTGSTT